MPQLSECLLEQEAAKSVKIPGEVMDKSIRILAVLPGMWARGGEISTLNLLTGLRYMRYNKLYFHAALKQALPAEMELYMLPRFQKVCRDVTWGIHGPTTDLSASLSSRITDIQPDILVYAWDKSIPQYAPSAKSVLVVHGIAPNDFDGYDDAHTDAVVCVSRCAAEMAKKHGIPEGKIHAIPNGVPKVAGTNKRKEWNIPEQAWVWCFVGGLTRLKRPNLLIAALARRKEQWPDEYIIFAGLIDGFMKLDEYATALGVRNQCKFLGHVDAIGDVYHSSDCLVVTSERESMPLTMLEAMSAGVPTVANNVGGIPEVVEPSSGLVVDVTKESEFDEALTQIRRMDMVAMSQNATICWFQHYSHTIMAESYLQLFEQLLQGE